MDASDVMRQPRDTEYFYGRIGCNEAKFKGVQFIIHKLKLCTVGTLKVGALEVGK